MSNRPGILALCWVAVTACAAPVLPTQVHGGDQRTGNRMVLLSSGTNRISTTVIDSFLRNTQAPVAEFSFAENASASALERGIRAWQPSVVVALGGRAVAFAESHLSDQNLLYGLVVRNEVERFKRPNLAGVALETSIATEFSLYRAVLPTLSHVVTFYNPAHSMALIARATDELQHLGIELVAVPVKSPEELIKAFRDRGSNQDEVLWMVSDVSILNETSFVQLRDGALANHQPLLCSSLREFAAAGALMAVDIDFVNVGAQLAEMADRIVNGQQADVVGLRSPIGGKLIVNMQTAEQVGVQVPKRVRPFISEMMASH